MAARGLDVDGINWVINYDYPNTSEDYIHRIGRTGRAESSGTSHTFFTESNANRARDLVAVLLEAKQEVPAELMEMARRGGAGGSNYRSRGYGGSYGSPYNKSFGGNSYNRNGGYNNNQRRDGYNPRNRRTFDDDD